MTLALAPRARPQADQLITPLDRLELLCDHGSLQLIRSEVISPVMGAKAQTGDGVLGGSGTIDGRPVFCQRKRRQYPCQRAYHQTAPFESGHGQGVDECAAHAARAAAGLPFIAISKKVRSSAAWSSPCTMPS